MTEHAQFLERDGERLYTFLHRTKTPPRHGVVLCAPLAEEKLWAHLVFVNLARGLAARGHAVLRFDFRGEGDSDRRFEETDLTTRVEDAAFAIDSLKSLVPGMERVSLVGLRLGASVAALAAAGRDDIARLVLWDPITDGAEYMQAVLRANLMYQMALHGRVIEGREALAERLNRGETVNVEGYELSRRLFSEVSTLGLAEVMPRVHAKTLVVAVPPREAPPPAALTALAEACPDGMLETAVEEPFWREIRSFYRDAGNLARLTYDWLGAEA